MADESIKTKRKRDPTFTYHERLSLVELVTKHFSVIECKKTDAESNRIRAAKWTEIEKMFNSTAHYMKRDVKVLKNLWDNLKRKAKTIITTEKQNSYGGPPNVVKPDLIMDMVLSLIRPQAEGLNNYFDSDSLPLETTLDLIIKEEKVEVPIESNHDFSNYTPNMINSPISETLVPPEDDIPLHNPEKSTRIPLRNGIVKPTRRRPKSYGAALYHKKLEALETAQKEATAVHEARMKILRLQELQEKEKLKQEEEKVKQMKIQTEILEKELQNM